MNSSNQEFQIPSLENLSLGEPFQIPNLTLTNSSGPSLSALASEHLTQNPPKLNFNLSVGTKSESPSLADIANLHLSSTDTELGAFHIPSLSGAEANKVIVPNLQFNSSKPTPNIDLLLALGQY